MSNTFTNKEYQDYIYTISPNSKIVINVLLAFWVGGRLVGEPSWELGKTMIRDGRTQFAKRYTVIVSTDDLFDEVLQDWTGFKDSVIIKKVYETVKKYIEDYIRDISQEQREETKLGIVRNNIEKFEGYMFRLTWDEVDQVLWWKKSTLKNDNDENSSSWWKKSTLNTDYNRRGII